MHKISRICHSECNLLVLNFQRENWKKIKKKKNSIYLLFPQHPNHHHSKNFGLCAHRQLRNIVVRLDQSDALCRQFRRIVAAPLECPHFAGQVLEFVLHVHADYIHPCAQPFACGLAQIVVNLLIPPKMYDKVQYADIRQTMFLNFFFYI